jgi:hypothetical protein
LIFLTWAWAVTAKPSATTAAIVQLKTRAALRIPIASSLYRVFSVFY